MIKYMGKTDAQGNRPTNSSLSYTLEHLRTHLELELISMDDGEDRWEPLTGDGLTELQLSSKGRERFLKHLSRLKQQWNFSGSFLEDRQMIFQVIAGLRVLLPALRHSHVLRHSQ